MSQFTKIVKINSNIIDTITIKFKNYSFKKKCLGKKKNSCELTTLLPNIKQNLHLFAKIKTEETGQNNRKHAVYFFQAQICKEIQFIFTF